MTGVGSHASMLVEAYEVKRWRPMMSRTRGWERPFSTEGSFKSAVCLIRLKLWKTGDELCEIGRVGELSEESLITMTSPFGQGADLQFRYFTKSLRLARIAPLPLTHLELLSWIAMFIATDYRLVRNLGKPTWSAWYSPTSQIANTQANYIAPCLYRHSWKLSPRNMEVLWETRVWRIGDEHVPC